jgi:hypothetical protein
MVRCYIVIGAATIYPELPVGREVVAITEDRRMRNGQMRRAYFGAKYRYTFTLTDATETERSTWLAAASLSSSVTLVDEQNVTRTVLVMSVRDDLTRTVPASEGGAATTGPGYYDLEVVVEEV